MAWDGIGLKRRIRARLEEKGWRSLWLERVLTFRAAKRLLSSSVRMLGGDFPKFDATECSTAEELDSDDILIANLLSSCGDSIFSPVFYYLNMLEIAFRV